MFWILKSMLHHQNKPLLAALHIALFTPHMHNAETHADRWPIIYECLQSFGTTQCSTKWGKDINSCHIDWEETLINVAY